MRYVESPELEDLSAQLSFATPEAHVLAAIDLYTTKPASSDRKLQRQLDRALDARALDEEDAEDDGGPDAGLSATALAAAAALSPPVAVSRLAGSLGTAIASDDGSPLLLSPPASLDRSTRRANSSSLPASPFGPLNQVASRKQYAYLIAVLNANDPDRDFSALQPDQFVRETSAQKVSHAVSSLLLGLGTRTPAALWETIDRNIDIKNSRMYSLVLPQQFLQDEPGAVWARMWFFFNKRRKRVVFFHIKALRAYSPDVKPEDHPEGEYSDQDLSLDEAILGDLD